VRGRGYLKSAKDIQQIVLKSENGTPVLLQDVGTRRDGPDERRGLTELNGQAEVVSRHSFSSATAENALSVIKNIKQKITELADGLPEGRVHCASL